MDSLNVREDSLLQQRLKDLELTDEHWSNLNKSIALIRKYFPKIDLYDSTLGGDNKRISFGTKNDSSKYGKPLFYIDTQHGGALIRLRSIGLRGSGGGEAGRFLTAQIGESWDNLRLIALDIFDFEGSRKEFEVFLKRIKKLSNNNLIASRVNGCARMPDDYVKHSTIESAPDEIEWFDSDKKQIAYLSSERRKEIEDKAIEYVWNKYESLGYKIDDRQAHNCGYDLLATKGNKKLELEVKGTVSRSPRFFISRNEYAYAKQKDSKGWRLIVIYNIDGECEELELTRQQLEERFFMDALCWECTENNNSQ